MWPTPQFPVDLITFTEEILNGKLFFLYTPSENGIFHTWSACFSGSRLCRVGKIHLNYGK